MNVLELNELLSSLSYNYIRVPENSSEVLTKCIHKIPELYRDKSVERFFEELLPGKCSYIGIESPYYDADFLSLYYSHYVKTFRRFEKECCRIILYDDNISSIGYVVLRPLPKGKKIGKTYLDPTVFADDNCYIICGPHKLHHLGSESVVNAFPYTKQESSVAICGHICLWSLNRFFSSRFSNRASYTIGDIAARISSHNERKVPSNGLTPQQISACLVDLGFDSIIIESKRSTSLREHLCAYLDSGLPVICISRSRQHAVVACGRTPAPTNQAQLVCTPKGAKRLGIKPINKENCFLLFESSLVTNFVINDDCEKMPYKIIGAEIGSTASTDDSNSDVLEYKSLNIYDIDACIVPLDPQMQLEYVQAKDLIALLFDKLYRTDTEKANNFHISTLSLVTANTFKEWIRENILNDTLPKAFLQLLGISFPKFLWLSTFASLEDYSAGKCSGFILLDPTCAITDEFAWLLIADHSSCLVHRSTSEFDGASPYWGFSYDKFKISLFKRNYVEVKKSEQENQY